MLKRKVCDLFREDLTPQLDPPPGQLHAVDSTASRNARWSQLAQQREGMIILEEELANHCYDYSSLFKEVAFYSYLSALCRSPEYSDPGDSLFACMDTFATNCVPAERMNRIERLVLPARGRRKAINHFCETFCTPHTVPALDVDALPYPGHVALYSINPLHDHRLN